MRTSNSFEREEELQRSALAGFAYFNRCTLEALFKCERMDYQFLTES